MKSLKKIQFCVFAVVALAILFPASVFAEDFIFSVPIELRNIPTALKSWELYVEVQDSAGKIIASARKDFIVNKKYVRTITVKFNCDSGKNNSAATHYILSLTVKDPTATRYGSPSIVMRQNGPYPWDTSKPFIYWSRLKRKIK